jgi:ATP-binding cassette subfamily C protein CydD
MAERLETPKAKAWLARETRLGQRLARRIVAIGVLQSLLATGQISMIALCLSRGAAGSAAGVLQPALGFLALAVLRAGLGIVSEREAAAAGGAARRRLRSDALSRLLEAGPAILRSSHSGELAALVVDRVEAMDGFYARWLPATTLALLGPAIVAACVALADWRAALILTAAGLLVPFGMAASGIGAAAAARNQFTALSRLQARFLDRVRGIATIVAAGRAEDEARALGHAADELRRRTMRILRVAFLSSTTLDLAAAAAIVILAIRLSGGPLTTASLFTLLAVPEFFAPLRAFAAVYQDKMQARDASLRFAALPDAPAPAPLREVRTVNARGVTIAFEGVGLTWDKARGPVFDQLSFRVPAGETLILTGPSGAGKSSVLEILLGFVRPDHGRVTINGADIAELTAPALNRLIAWVGQRPVLFAGTLRDNIRFARPEATDDEVESAVRAARMAGFVETLPLGLDTPIGEDGFGLSGGQAQRVAVARAYLKNAPILLLDEPTAHLDPATEGEVLESLRRLVLGRTVILATHSAAAQTISGRRLDLQAAPGLPRLGAA